MSSYHELADNDPIYRQERKHYLNRMSRCRICGKHVERNKRSIDHIIPMWRYIGNYWDRFNWQMLCETCHRIKTRLEGNP